jgi:hypothetical protein
MGFTRVCRAVLFTFAFLQCCVLCRAQTAAATPASEPSQHAVLVELFTSEGCSDCPPADLVLQKINGHTTAAGTPIITLSEHVTYWNRLGWADPYSDEAYTRRQVAYTEQLKGPEPFTPMAVVMGSTVLNGADGNRILQAVDADRSHALTLHIDSHKVDGKRLQVTFSTAGSLPRNGVDILAFLTDDTDVSEVSRGENQGRTLTHVSVVRKMQRWPTIKVAGAQSAAVDLPQSKGPHHLVLVAQEPDTGKVLAAETMALL